MKISELEQDILVDYQNNTPLELIANEPYEVDVNDFIVLSIALGKYSQSDKLDACLCFLDEVKRSFIDRGYDNEIRVDTEHFKFVAVYTETTWDEGLHTEEMIQSFDTWFWEDKLGINEEALNYLGYKLDLIVDEYK